MCARHTCIIRSRDMKSMKNTCSTVGVSSEDRKRLSVYLWRPGGWGGGRRWRESVYLSCLERKSVHVNWIKGLRAGIV